MPPIALFLKRNSYLCQQRRVAGHGKETVRPRKGSRPRLPLTAHIHTILTMQEKLIIRKEESCDFDQIRNVIRLAFWDMEESDHTEHRLVERLRQSEAYIPALSLVAESDGNKIVGHIMLSTVEVVSETMTETLLSVAPLSVLPEFQRRGIGGKLLSAAHKRAADLGFKGIVLLGHPDYYPRFGYQRASRFGITFPFDAPDACAWQCPWPTEAWRAYTAASVIQVLSMKRQKYPKHNKLTAHTRIFRRKSLSLCDI